MAALLCLAALFTGCGKGERLGVQPTPSPSPEPLTAASLLAEVQENLLRQGGVQAEIQGSLDYVVAERELRLDLALHGESGASPLTLHAEGTAGMDSRGITMDVPLELYALEQEGGAVIYLNVLGEWTKKSVPGSLSGASGGNELLQSAAVLREGREMVNGHSCYRLDIPVTAQMLSQASRGLALTAPESGPELRSTLWVDGESRLPVRLSLSLTEPVVSGDLDLRELELLLDLSAFGPVEGLTPPPQALNAPELGE